MTAASFCLITALTLIAPHTSEPVAKAGTVLMLFASLIALAIELSR